MIPKGTGESFSAYQLLNLTWAVTLAVLLSGCQFDPFAHTYTTAQPDESKIVGHYQLVMQTLTTNGVAQFSGQLPSIDLRVDGTFSATNIPPWGISFPDTNFLITLVSGSGQWSIESVGSVDNGATLQTIWGVRLDPSNGKAVFDFPKLMGTNSPYGLIFTLGDPDSGHVMIFGRELGDGNVVQPDLFGPPDLVGAVLFLCGFLAVVAALLAIIGIAGGIIAVLVLFGIVSSSIFAGWVTKRTTFGLRTFMAQIFALAAMPLGIAATWAIVKLNAWQLPFWKILLTGAISGLIAGLAIAFALT
jgi:hypothetical protein